MFKRKDKNRGCNTSDFETKEQTTASLFAHIVKGKIRKITPSYLSAEIRAQLNLLCFGSCGRKYMYHITRTSGRI